MMHLFLVAVGGCFGAVSRYALSSWIQQSANSLFPWGTLLVNLSGSFVIGFLYQLFETLIVPPELKSLLTIGFLGAFTTFSSFSMETLNMLRDGEVMMASVNILVNNAAGIALAFAGIGAFKLIMLAAGSGAHTS
jgi:fluoride exporter